MSLRSKTLIILALTVVGLFAILYGSSRMILMHGYRRIEDLAARENVERVLSALSEDLSNLLACAGNWAARDDTYAFMETGAPEYVAKNLGDDMFAALPLSVAAFVDTSGKLVFGKAFDFESKRETSFPASLREHLSGNALLLFHPDPSSRRRGVISLPEGPMLVASHPVLTSGKRGPVRGALILGRRLTPASLRRLAEIRHLSVSFRRHSGADTPYDFDAVGTFMSAPAPIVLDRSSSDSITGSSRLRDIYGINSVEVRVDLPRYIYRQASISMIYFALSLMVAGLTFGLVIQLVLEKQVLSRLARLNKSVAEIGASGDLASRVAAQGHDELSSLGQAINEMLAKLEGSEKALQASEGKLEAMLQCIPDYMIMVDRGLNVVWANEAVARLTGGDPVGRKCCETYRRRQTPCDPSVCLARQAFADGAPHEGDAEVVGDDGEKLWFQCTANVALRDAEGKPSAVLEIARDITKRKRAEAEAKAREQQLIQADKMASLGILVSGVAHEINNPNQFIMSNVAPLRRIWRDATPVLERYYEDNGDFAIGGGEYSTKREQIPVMFSNILEGASRIKTIVSELREYARERPAVMTDSVDLNAVVRSALALLGALVKKSTQHFSVSYGEDLPALQGNYQRLEQVVINAVQNACQALPSDEAAIRVSTSYDAKAERLVIKVADEGVGIAEKALRHVTDPFYTTKRDQSGTGLGLSISASIVAEHDGTLGFASVVGKGTTVTVSLPVKRRDGQGG